MFFISKRARANFYNNSKLTFLVQKECVDIIFKIKKGVYLTVSVLALDEGRFLLACSWEGFWNRLKRMGNLKDVLLRLRKTCPLTFKALTNTESIHFAYLDTEKEKGAIVQEMIAPIQSNNISDYLHEKVIDKAMELMDYNLNMYVELEEKCPFAVWKNELKGIFH